MKKTLPILICIIAALGLFLCGCNGHTHTYDKVTWKWNETEHWHAATCEHKDEVTDKGAHRDEDNDGKCDVCGYAMVPSEHTHSLRRVDKVEPTCTEAGMNEYYTCSGSDCKGKFFDKSGTEVTKESLAIEPLGHDLKKHDKADSTCTKQGNIEYWKCDRCGNFFTDSEGKNQTTEDKVTLPLAEHSLTIHHDAVEGKCNTPGTIEYDECDKCGAKFNSDGQQIDDITGEKSPFNHEAKLEHRDKQEPTCTADGIEAHYYCPACMGMFTDAEGQHAIEENGGRIPALGHDCEGEDYIQTKTGHYRMCRRCQQPEEESPHVAGPNGLCTVCGYKMRHEHELQAHEPELATCTQEGKKAYWYCETCQKYFLDSNGLEETDANGIVEPMKAHEIVNEFSETEHWRGCKNCDYEEDGSKGEHKMECGVCVGDGNGSVDFTNGCGYEDLHEEDGLAFGEEDGKWYVRRLAKGNTSTSEVVIPENITVEGKKETVIGIWSDALEEMTIQALVLPSSLKEIKSNAFYNSTVTDIFFEGNKDEWEEVDIEELGNDAITKGKVYIFSAQEPKKDDYGLYYHKDNDGNRIKWKQNIDPENMPTYGVVYTKSSTKEEYSVTGLESGYEGFVNNYNILIRIHNVYNRLPVTSIDSNALSFIYIRQVIIPENIVNLGINFISQDVMPNIQWIYYGSGNKESVDKSDWEKIHNYGQVDFSKVALYSKTNPSKPASEGRYWHFDDNDNPVLWPAYSETGGTTLELVGDNYVVTGVEADAECVTIPEKYQDKAVTTIKSGAFKNNNSLKYIIIPESVTTIEQDAFSKCSVRLYYKGNESNWEKIPNIDNVLKGCEFTGLNKHVWFYSSDTPSTKGRFWKFASDGITPVEYTQYQGGGKIPSDEVIIDGIAYVLSDNLDYYIAVTTVPSSGIYFDGPAYLKEDINGVPVKKINADAFYTSSHYKGNNVYFRGSEVLIPASIDEIGEWAFKSGLRIYYGGSSLEKFKAIKGVDKSGIDNFNQNYDSVYCYYDEKTEGDSNSRYWTYQNGVPTVYVPQRGTEYNDSKTGYTYRYYEDNTACIINYKQTGTSAILRIPDSVKINGTDYKITEIGNEAFTSVKDIIGLVIPDTIVTIHEKAFAGINSLEWVVFGSKLEGVGLNAFYRFESQRPTTAFKTVTDEESGKTTLDNVIIYYNGDEDKWNSFVHGFADWHGAYGIETNEYKNGNLKVLFYTDSKPTSDADKYWHYESNMPTAYTANIFIRNGMEFEYFDNNTAIVKRATDPKMTQFLISETYTFNEKTYTVTEIAANAFDYSVTKVKAELIVIPKTVKKIGNYAFNGQSSLKEIAIGDVEELSRNNQFNGCHLTGVNDFSDIIVYYWGNEAEYANSAVKDVFKNNIHVYFYSDEKPESDVTEYWHLNASNVPEVYKDGTEWTDPSSGVIYTYYEEYAEASGYDEKKIGKNSVLVINNEIEVSGKKYPVTGIAEKAFYVEIQFVEGEQTFVGTTFKAVILPKTITNIGRVAFKSQHELEYIVISNGIEAIGEDAFDGAFARSAKLFFNGDEKDVETFREKITAIDAESARATGLLSLTLYSYKSNTPTSGDRYWHFTNQQNSEAAAWNENKYTDTKTNFTYAYNTVTHTAIVLSYGGTNTEISIPNSVEINNQTYQVTAIANDAFRYDDENDFPRLTGVIIPSTVTEIGGNAFYDQNLSYIVFPSGIKYLSSDWFKRAFAANVKFYFDGTEEECDSFMFGEDLFYTEISSIGGKVYIKGDENTDTSYGVWKYENDKPKPIKEPTDPSQSTDPSEESSSM